MSAERSRQRPNSNGQGTHPVRHAPAEGGAVTRRVWQVVIPCDSSFCRPLDARIAMDRRRLITSLKNDLGSVSDPPPPHLGTGTALRRLGTANGATVWRILHPEHAYPTIFTSCTRYGPIRTGPQGITGSSAGNSPSDNT